ncbi:Myo5, partial [Trypoxylus dichotomus]
MMSSTRRMLPEVTAVNGLPLCFSSAKDICHSTSLQPQTHRLTVLTSTVVSPLKLTTFKSLEIEHKNLNNVLAQRDAKIAELENLLKNERDEKMDLVNEHDKYKQESEEQRNVWSEEMSKLRRELDNINEIVKNYEQHGEEDMNERIEHEKLLILNEQDNDRHAYQKLLQEYHCLEQHCEDLEQQIKDQNKQTHHHIRNVSDVSSISSIADTVITTSDLPEDHGYGSTRSTSSSQHPKIDSIDWENANANSTLVASAAMTNSEINHEKKEEELDIGLLLKLQHKLSEVEREKNRLQKRLDDLDTSPRTERADNAIKDSQRISELELYISTLKAHLYELQDGIEEGSGLLKLQEQNRMLHDEMERRSEEIVQLKSVLAEQTNNMKTLVGSRTRTGEYINEDGELALAYETQKTINKQLELELQDEMAKYKAHEKEYKLEIEKLREDNDRQQRLLADNLHVTPQSKGQAYMQHEITKLTKENLELQDKCDTAADVVRKLKRQIKLLVKKLRESGIDIDEAMNDLNTQDEGLHKHGRTPNIRKKERDYLGMFSFKAGDEPLLTKQLVIDLKPRTAVTLLPGLPAYVVFMCIRHTDFINDEDKVKALLSNFSICVKKVVKKRHEDFESVVLWLSNTL